MVHRNRRSGQDRRTPLARLWGLKAAISTKHNVNIEKNILSVLFLVALDAPVSVLLRSDKERLVRRLASDEVPLLGFYKSLSGNCQI